MSLRPVIVSVEDMLKAMNRVEEGDFSTRVEKRKNMPAEMNEIADGFNEMVKRTDLLLGQVRQAALEQKNAEISALEAQIDPHFLYNTFNCIRGDGFVSRGEGDRGSDNGAVQLFPVQCAGRGNGDCEGGAGKSAAVCTDYPVSF
mgnify:CR=1 FL=1